MKIHAINGAIVVALSRKNLTELLAMLDARGHGAAGLVRRCEGGVFLQVKPEEDAPHYGDRQAGEGYRPDAAVDAFFAFFRSLNSQEDPMKQ